MGRVRPIAPTVMLSTACRGGTGSALDAAGRDASTPIPDASIRDASIRDASIFDSSTDAELCPGGTPTIDDCFTGYFFADCGGPPGPRLACPESSAGIPNCVWLTGQCVPAGFDVSPCSADAICCLDNWPFPPTPFPDYQLYELFLGLGTLPWDRSRAMALSLVVDPTITAGVPTFACDASLFYPNICDGMGNPTPGISVRDTIVFRVRDWGDSSGVSVWMELDHAQSPPVARLCREQHTDYLQSVCPRAEVDCATSGTITIDRIPTSFSDAVGLKVNIDAFFNGGYLPFQGSFAYE